MSYRKSQKAEAHDMAEILRGISENNSKKNLSVLKMSFALRPPKFQENA